MRKNLESLGGAGFDDDLLVKSGFNPILEGEKWPYRVNTVMNAGAAKLGNETILLCRVEDRRGFSHLSVARSMDGMTGWRIDEKPLVSPGGPGCEWGVEDPRVTWIPEIEKYVIAYTIYGPAGAKIAIAATKDFLEIEELSVVPGPDNKNGVILPRTIDGKFILLSRPAMNDRKPGIYISYSEDLINWEGLDLVMNPRDGNWWDSRRIGAGAPPIETEHGWLFVYHGVRSAVSGDIYRAGIALLDKNDPSKVTHRGEEWILTPDAEYELSGDVPGVVFPCGLIVDGDNLRVYYGAADTCLGVAFGSLSEMLNYVLTCPVDE